MSERRGGEKPGKGRGEFLDRTTNQTKYCYQVWRGMILRRLRSTEYSLPRTRLQCPRWRRLFRFHDDRNRVADCSCRMSAVCLCLSWGLPYSQRRHLESSEGVVGGWLNTHPNDTNLAYLEVSKSARMLSTGTGDAVLPSPNLIKVGAVIRAHTWTQETKENET